MEECFQQIINFSKNFFNYKKDILSLLNNGNEINISCSFFPMENLANFLKKINYEELKQKIEKNNSDEAELIEFLKSKDVKNTDIPNLDQIILITRKELLDSLKANTKIYLVIYKLWNDNFKNENKITKGEFSCIIKNKIIYISFNENEKLSLKKKNNIIIIDKDSLIVDENQSNINTKDETTKQKTDTNENNINNHNLNIDNIKIEISNDIDNIGNNKNNIKDNDTNNNNSNENNLNTDNSSNVKNAIMNNNEEEIKNNEENLTIKKENKISEDGINNKICLSDNYNKIVTDDEKTQGKTINHDSITNLNIVNNDNDSQLIEKNKQIKLIINLYLFDLEIKTHIAQTYNNNNFFISECYLINNTWIKKYKDFYKYDQIIADLTKVSGIKKIIKERIGKNKEIFEKLCFEMNNYSTMKLKNTYNLPEEKYGEKSILVENKQISNNLINGNFKINYPILFEIISEQIYELLFKENTLNNNSLILQKYKLIINEGKIIITNVQESNFLLIINVNNDSYENEYLLYLKHNKNTTQYFDYLKKNPLSKCIKTFFPGLNYIISYKEKEGKFEIYGKIINLKNQINNEYQISINDMNKINNDIDFIIKLYFYYDEFNYLLNQKFSKNFQRKKYALININLLEIYKNFYNYSEIKEIIKSNNVIQNIINKYKNDKSYIDHNNIEIINEIKKQLPVKIIDDIINKNKGEYFKEFSKMNIDKINIITKKLSDNYQEISYYDNYFLLDEELTKLLSQNKEFHMINYVTFGEEKIFLKIEEKNKIFINIAEFNKDRKLFECELVINCQKENIDSINENIFNNGYKKYASSLKFNEKNIARIENVFAYKIKERPYFKTIIDDNKENKGNDINKGKIQIENLNNELMSDNELQNIILIFIDNEIIKQKIEKKMNNIKEEYYLVNYEWLSNYISRYKLTDIYNYMNKKKNINDKIIKIITDKNIDINKRLEKCFSGIDNKLINQRINKNNVINYKNIPFITQKKIISINKTGKEITKINCYNNFILLSKYTVDKLVKDYPIIINDIEEVYKIILAEKKIFLSAKNSLQIGIFTKDYVFNLKYIFYFYSNLDLEKSIDFLIEKDFDKFCKDNLIFNDINNYNDDDIFSPIFNKENQIIGDCLKFRENINDYSKYQTNKKLRTAVKLYLNYLHLNKYCNSKDLIKGNFYLVQKNQISKIKEDYNYDQIKNELTNKNPIIKHYSDKKEKNIFDEKLISRIIKHIDPKIKNNFNEIEKKNEKEKQEDNVNKNEGEYGIESMKKPNEDVYMFFNEHNNEEFFMYYSNFELLSKQLKEKNNKQENKEKNFVDCYFIDGIILINCSSINLNNNKIVFEAGSLDNDNSFILSHLLVFNNSNNLEYIIKNLSEQKIKNLFKKVSSNKNEKNGISLYNKEGSIIGILIKHEFQNLNENQNNKNLNIINDFIIVGNNNINDINDNNNPNDDNHQNHNPIDIEKNKPKDNIFNKEESELQGLLIIYYENIETKDNNIKSIKDFFKGFPPKIGLKNVGCTCYMNATLQCFCQIEKLVNYFKYHRRVIDKIQDNIFYNENKNNENKKNILTSSFKYLIEHLWPTINEINEKFASNQNENSNNSSYAPSEFKKKISEMDPLFAGAQANDAKDLVNFIIMTLHQELNKANLNDEINQDNIIVDDNYQQNQQMMLQNFAKKFAIENKSIISDLFYAIYGSSISCTNCGTTKYNYQTYFFLTFPLEEVRKFVLNYQMMNNMMQFQQNYYCIQNINSVNIYDCFNYNQRPELMSGANSMYCNNCQNNFPFWNKPFITTGPEILIIVLNRGKGIQFDVKLEFYESLNLQNYIQMQDSGTYYNLIGVVTHMGLSGATGHFVATCKSPIDGNWYNYNDDLVSPVYNFKEQIIDYAMPYILFYQKFH